MKAWLRRHIEWLFFILMAFIFAVGILLVRVGAEFWTAVGHALIVAAVLGATVDFFLKARLLRDVTNNVARYLIGYDLPPEIRDRIHALMRTQKVSRSFDVRCRLSELHQKPGIVLLDVTLGDEIDDISNEPVNHVDVLEYERNDPQVVLEMRCDSSDPKAIYRNIGSDLGEIKTDEPGAKIARGKKVVIPPHNRDIKKTYRFESHYQIEYTETDSEVISFLSPTFGVTVTFDKPKDYAVSLSPKPDMQNENRWVYDRLFLTDTYIRIRWAKQTAVASSAASANR